MIRLTQTTSLQQKMAPQLIQSLRLLQMPTLELEQLIQQELQINPLLEMSEDDSEEEEEEWEVDDEVEASTELESPEEKSEESQAEDEKLDEIEFDDADMDDGQYDEDYWNEFLNDSGYSAPAEEFDPNIEDWDNDGASPASLAQSLKEQLLLTDLDAAQRDIGEYIIGNIDEDGFLRASLEDVATVLSVEVEKVEAVLAAIHTFEPSGVGARDLRECLMIQIRELGHEDALAMHIVREHLDDLVNRRYSKITRSLGIERDAIGAALDLISELNPKPMVYREEKINHNLIVPDLEVQKVGDEWVVSHTDRNMPSLRVSPVYRTLLSGSERAGREAKKFVVDRLNSARWFISAINQRRTTMLKVMRCIVESQIGFFEDGPGHLRPMVLQEVADKVGMHVSTISRVSNGKYVQTPHGVNELKYFFDGGLSTEDGDDVSAKTVKEKIAKMISGEDTKSPLSDQKIADILKKEGIDIARRTVAKYRDQLEINPARYRKEI